LTRLRDASSLLASSRDFREILDICATFAEELMDARSVTIYILNQSKTAIEPIISRENNKKQSLSIPLKVGEGISGKVAATGKSEMVNRIDLVYEGKQIPGTLFESESSISIPIKVRNKVIGVMTVSRSEERKFVNEDLILLEHLANISALAVENAKLYSKTMLAEKDLLAAKEQVKVSDRVKSSFLDAMSHEVRTPMNSILGFTELLAFELKPKLTQRQKEYLETITQSGQRLNQLIENILDMSDIEAENMPLDLVSLPADEIVEECFKDTKLSAEQKSLEVEESYEAPDTNINVDSWRFQQALRNLLQNAVKYTPNGGITLSTIVSDGKYVISIEDTGIGINEEFVPHLFTQFRQGDEGLSRTYEGIGLGLSIAHRLIIGMGGSLDVQSEIGNGSRFTVRFPVVVTQAQKRLQHKMSSRVLDFNFGSSAMNSLQSK